MVVGVRLISYMYMKSIRDEYSKKREKKYMSELKRLGTHRLNVIAFETKRTYVFDMPWFTVFESLELKRIKKKGWVCPLP